MKLFEICCVFFLSIIFLAFILLSILREFKKLEKYFNRFPVLMGFIPSWSFFAPVPSFLDYSLVFRRVSNNGEVGEWHDCLSTGIGKSRFTFCWNPEKRERKALFDVVQELLVFSNKVKDKAEICTSVPYLQLLNFVTSKSTDSSVEQIQFMVLSSSMVEDFKKQFLSEVHALS